ncbi:hypothetical protein ABT168_27725 [Streptomyces sp. NPDC001793]|uniref:hypothetical protein n=1 Tax=Streptomyces sp. NPDC001793 TaxID=3154657 RepID=UPI00332FC5C4
MPMAGDTAKPSKSGSGAGSGVGTGGAGGVRPAADSSSSAVSASAGGDRQLAAPGVGPATPWAIGGSAVALTAGAGLVVAARRRTSAGH